MRLLWLPFLLVLTLIGFFYTALQSGDPSTLPSALIGKPVPEFNLPALGGEAGLSSATFAQGKPALLNIWASWCAPCQAEHPVLMDLAQKGIPVYGINYKDAPDAAGRVLTRLGNPYRAIGADKEGGTAIDFGVYGVPETFVIDGKGVIVFRFPGPLTPQIVESKILPALKDAEAHPG
jgi:cytochrome c biogenesis protein CcmG, thiol:disulfide interchange protein DsbE